MPKLLPCLLFLSVAPQVLAEQDNALESRVSKLEESLRATTLSLTDAASLVTIGGRLQIDFSAFNGAYNADHGGATGSTIYPRRARLSAQGERHDLEYKMILEFAEDTAEILLLRFEYHGFENGPTIKLGKIREDITLDALTSSKHMALIERSAMANTMSPYFRWGIAANQYFKTTGLRYAVGVHKNDAFGSAGEDEHAALSLALTGRVTWAYSVTDNQLLHLGSWASYRQMDGSILSPSFARAEIREPNVRLVNYAAGGDSVAVDDFIQYGIESAYQYESVLLQAEYAQRDITTTDPTHALNGESYGGYYFSASYMLTGERKSYSYSGARFNQPKGVQNAWEIAARYSAMDATSALQGTRSQTMTAGISYYIDEQTKLMLNAIHSEVSGPGALALIGEHPDGDAITMRFHYDF